MTHSLEASSRKVACSHLWEAVRISDCAASGPMPDGPAAADSECCDANVIKDFNSMFDLEGENDQAEACSVDWFQESVHSMTQDGHLECPVFEINGNHSKHSFEASADTTEGYVNGPSGDNEVDSGTTSKRKHFNLRKYRAWIGAKGLHIL